LHVFSIFQAIKNPPAGGRSEYFSGGRYKILTLYFNTITYQIGVMEDPEGNIF